MKKEKKKKKVKKRNKKTSTILLIIIFVIGLSLLLYPTISNRWNSYHQTKTLIRHAENVAKLSKEECEALRSAAVKYNESLRGDGSRWHLTEEDRKLYNSLLVFDETEIISSIEIPKIKVSLPIFHGTGKNVLQTAIGHLEGSSLPVGGEGSHSVLTGHRGLASATLLTDLDQMEEGDRFYIHILGQDLAYEVDQIVTVLPHEISELDIVPGEDYVTLVTCTPYAVNSHRLFVRGHRTEYLDDDAAAVARGKSPWTLPVRIVLIGLLIAAVSLVGILIVKLRKQRGEGKRS